MLVYVCAHQHTQQHQHDVLQPHRSLLAGLQVLVDQLTLGNLQVLTGEAVCLLHIIQCLRASM